MITLILINIFFIITELAMPASSHINST